MQGESARIVSGATLPIVPSFPRSDLVYGFFGIFGLVLGCLLAFLIEYLRSGVKTGAEAVRAFGYPVLGTIPRMRSGRRGGALEPISLVQAMVDAPLSDFSEAIRATRLS